MDTVTTIIVATLSSSLLTALLNNIFTLINKKNDKNDAIRKGIKLILHSKIKHLGQKYIEAGQVSYADLEDFLNMHQCYHVDFGGNGCLNFVVSTVKELPIIK